MHDSNQSELTKNESIRTKKLGTQSQFESTRRKILKSMTYGSAAAALPLLPAVASLSSGQSPLDADYSANSIHAEKLPLQPSGVAVEFSDPESNHIDGAMARVSISNNSNKDIELKHLSPGAITTKDGVYNLNARLEKSPVQIRPQGVYHLWIRPDNEVHSIAPSNVNAGSHGMIPVTIVRGNTTARPAQHTRLAHAMFA